MQKWVAQTFERQYKSAYLVTGRTNTHLERWPIDNNIFPGFNRVFFFFNCCTWRLDLIWNQLRQLRQQAPSSLRRAGGRKGSIVPRQTEAPCVWTGQWRQQFGDCAAKITKGARKEGKKQQGTPRRQDLSVDQLCNLRSDAPLTRVFDHNTECFNRFIQREHRRT